jgi:hypothetical protein
MGTICTCYPRFWVKKSMTAIIRTLTFEGYVLAADGRSTGAVDGSIFSDSVQKIFPIKTPVGSFAYTLAGTVHILTDDSREIAIDFVDELRKSADALSERKTKDLMGYAVRLFRPIMRAVRDAHESGRFSMFPSNEPQLLERGNTILRVSIDGLWNGFPSSVTVRIFHENGRLCDPEMSSSVSGQIVAEGRPQIAWLLWQTDDHRFTSYRVPLPEQLDATLDVAISRSRSYILAHTDPEAIAIDPLCSGVGGHIHIATITAAEGFKWVI